MFVDISAYRKWCASAAIVVNDSNGCNCQMNFGCCTVITPERRKTSARIDCSRARLIRADTGSRLNTKQGKVVLMR